MPSFLLVKENFHPVPLNYLSKDTFRLLLFTFFVKITDERSLDMR